MPYVPTTSESRVDRRIRRTQKSLHEALISLVLEKSYDSITVQEILDRADIGRSTFYAHFDGKDKLTVTRDGKEVVEGRYTVNKDEIELTDERGPFAGTGDTKTGTYKWKLDGGKLTFTKVKDESEGRSRILTTGAWERQEND